MPSSSAPFRRIADELRGQVLAGSLAPGDRLPSEHELAESYDTTRTTVRKAIALLRSEGYVLSEQGRGVFVRKRPSVTMLLTGANYRKHRSSGTSNFNAEALSQGMRAEQRILRVAEVGAPHEIAERLDVPEDTPVIVRRRLFLIDGEPMQLCNGYYPAELFRSTPISQPEKIRGGVHSIFEDPHGPIASKVTRFVEDVQVRLPSPSETEALVIAEGVPIARALRTAIDKLGRRLEVLDSTLPSDRYTFRYVIDLP